VRPIADDGHVVDPAGKRSPLKAAASRLPAGGIVCAITRILAACAARVVSLVSPVRPVLLLRHRAPPAIRPYTH